VKALLPRRFVILIPENRTHGFIPDHKIGRLGVAAAVLDDDAVIVESLSQVVPPRLN